MRVIAGTFRSRALKAPPGRATRPTLDRLRETLFNVLAPRLPGSAFLDLFAGSGAVGIEAISRGAAQATFVERAPAALAVLRENLASLGLTPKPGDMAVQVHAGSVAAFLRRPSSVAYNLIFLDPPYEDGEAYSAALELLGGQAQPLLAPDARIVAEHRRKQRLAERFGRLSRARLLEQGEAALSFYSIGEG